MMMTTNDGMYPNDEAFRHEICACDAYRLNFLSISNQIFSVLWVGGGTNL